MSDAEFHDGCHNAAKYWRQLQEARRENADLRVKGGHLAAERDALRAELADLHNVEAVLRAQCDDLARILNCVKTMIAPLVQEES